MEPFYDIGGTPITFDRWAELRDDPDYCRVELTDIDDDIQVSTVWVGMTLTISYDPTPVIFETMIFGGPHNGDQWRYATLEEARAGHETAVQIAKTG